MKDSIFLDTNILLYAFSKNDVNKHEIAKNLALSDAVISAQVINEVSVNLLKKLKLTENEIQMFVKSSYARYNVVALEFETFLIASNLRKKYLFLYYDSVIVAAAIKAKCKTLYSEDMQNGILVDGIVTIVNPFD